MDIPSSVQSCGGIRIRLTCIIPYKSCPLFALCSDPTNCRLCPSTFLISGTVLFFPSSPPPPSCCPRWPWHVLELHGIDNYTHICCLLSSSLLLLVGDWQWTKAARQSWPCADHMCKIKARHFRTYIVHDSCSIISLYYRSSSSLCLFLSQNYSQHKSSARFSTGQENIFSKIDVQLPNEKCAMNIFKQWEVVKHHLLVLFHQKLQYLMSYIGQASKSTVSNVLSSFHTSSVNIK